VIASIISITLLHSSMIKSVIYAGIISQLQWCEF